MKNMTRLLPRVLALLVLVGALIAPARRAAAAGVVTAATLPAALDAAVDGAVIDVYGGVLAGGLVIDRPVTLIGHDGPVIDGGGSGTVVQIAAPNVTLTGFVIRNSGSSLDAENAGIAVEAASATVADNHLENTLFGIYLRQADGSTLRGNQISSQDLEVQRRGDPIRVWYSNDVLIENNVVRRGRDVVLWYSERLTVRGNDVSGGRYGLHFMYCDDALIETNRLLDNSVGAFLMYSRRMHMRNNTVAGNRGPSGYGIGLKDMDDAIVENNLFLDNRIGAYLDGSPREVDSIGHFAGNVFGYNDVGVQLLTAVRHNVFENNSFVENQEQVSITGGGRPGENAWSSDQAGNYWSDYAGYDAGSDGIGDMPYRSEKMFEDLADRIPSLRLFLYSPATNALDFAARAFPAVRPQPKLVDDYPLLAPVLPDAPALPRSAPGGWLAAGAGLMALSALFIYLPRRFWRRYDRIPL